MIINNIWDILQIPSTTDKKAIKKAYAKLTKTIHPEEKPEDFKQLYEAYQTALAYADGKNVSVIVKSAERAGKVQKELAERAEKYQKKSAKRAEKVQKETAQRTEKIQIKKIELKDNIQEEKSSVEVPQEDDSELHNTFRESEEKRDIFLKAWKRFLLYKDYPAEIKLWIDFMSSDLFKEIHKDLWVVTCIVNGLNKDQMVKDDIYQAIWKVYRFDDFSQEHYHQELRILYDCLSEKIGYIRREEMRLWQAKRENEREQNSKKTIRTVFIVINLIGLIWKLLSK